MDRTVTRFTPPEPPKTRRSNASRQRIMQAAGELFLERGYDAVSMNDVAHRAELTKGGLYGHFRSKGQLLVEVIRAKYRDYEASEEFAQAIAEPKTGMHTLWSPGSADIRLLVTDAAAAARHDPDVRAGMAALDAERAAAVKQRLDGLQADGEAVAWLLIGLTSGIGLREALGVTPPDKHSLDAAVARLVDALLD